MEEPNGRKQSLRQGPGAGILFGRPSREAGVREKESETEKKGKLIEGLLLITIVSNWGLKNHLEYASALPSQDRKKKKIEA